MQGVSHTTGLSWSCVIATASVEMIASCYAVGSAALTILHRKKKIASFEVEKLYVMRKKILVVVDYQYDFYSPQGALYVAGGENLQKEIADIVPDFDHVLFTQDCHPASHCSFDRNGGQWPVHCVEQTLGAEIPNELIALCSSYTISKKGCDQNMEEYGAFADKDASEGLFAGAQSVVVCGIAGDYCVLETLKNIVSIVGSDRVSVYLDGVASIDGGTALSSYMTEQGIKEYKVGVEFS